MLAYKLGGNKLIIRNSTNDYVIQNKHTPHDEIEIDHDELKALQKNIAEIYANGKLLYKKLLFFRNETRKCIASLPPQPTNISARLYQKKVTAKIVKFEKIIRQTRKYDFQICWSFRLCVAFNDGRILYTLHPLTADSMSLTHTEFTDLHDLLRFLD